MIVQTTLRKILDQDFAPTLKRVMGKWQEAGDIFSFVKIAGEVEAQAKAYFSTREEWGKANGYKLRSGVRSANPEQITDDLLQQYGRFGQDAKLTLVGASEDDKNAFLEEKLKADAIMMECAKTMETLVDAPLELSIPKKIRVDPKHLRKECISARDCYVLEPLLDLTAVGELDSRPDAEEHRGDE